MRPTATGLDREIREHADADRADKAKAYLKSDLTHYGVATPVLHDIARRTARPLARGELLTLAAELWDEPEQHPVYERRFVAADLLAARADVLTPEDVTLLDRLLRESRTWALIDTLAPRVVGPVAEAHPEALTPVLDHWATDPDFWLRRTALLSHLLPLRSGGGDWQRFTRYADDLLHDREFFVAKAIGWVLRDTGRRRPGLVQEWVIPRATRMSAITVRVAAKPLPPAAQEQIRRLRSARPAASPG